MKWLVIEEPYKEAERREWNTTLGKTLFFDAADRAALEEGSTVFRAGIAYSLEEQEV